jgi:hypothetical protein
MLIPVHIKQQTGEIIMKKSAQDQQNTTTRTFARSVFVAGAIAVFATGCGVGTDDSSTMPEAAADVVAEQLDATAIVEANRGDVLRDLAAQATLDGFAVAEANRVEMLRDLQK